MFFDIGIGELLMIGVVGLIILGPDRLPSAAAQAARVLRQLREQLSDARATIIEAADIDPATLKDLADLDPRSIAREVTKPITDVQKPVDRATDLRDIS
jgi:sec-independent protein translocase protein TatB